MRSSTRRRWIGRAMPGRAISVKSRMPWLSGSCPVAIVVHTTGDQAGTRVLRGALTPRAQSSARFGSLPCCMSGRMRFQSAPSTPSRTTGLGAAARSTSGIFGAGALRPGPSGASTIHSRGNANRAPSAQRAASRPAWAARAGKLRSANAARRGATSAPRKPAATLRRSVSSPQGVEFDTAKLNAAKPAKERALMRQWTRNAARSDVLASEVKARAHAPQRPATRKSAP